MKKIFVLIFLSLIILPSCTKKTSVISYNSIIKVNQTEEKVYSKYTDNIFIEVLDNSTKSEGVTLKITQPDLIKIFDEVIKENPNKSPEQLVKILHNSLNRYTIDKTIHTKATKKGDNWIIDNNDVDQVIEELMSEFYMHYLLQVEFNQIEWEETK